MTLNKLIKELTKLQAKHGRCDINVNKASLWDGNGTFVVCGIEKVSAEWISECDGDGFRIENKDGSERGRIRVVLSGAS